MASAFAAAFLGGVSSLRRCFLGSNSASASSTGGRRVHWRRPLNDSVQFPGVALPCHLFSVAPSLCRCFHEGGFHEGVPHILFVSMLPRWLCIGFPQWWSASALAVSLRRSQLWGWLTPMAGLCVGWLQLCVSVEEACGGLVGGGSLVGAACLLDAEV